MNVLKIVIVSLFFVKLFAINLYLPEDFRNINIKNITIKRYKSKKDINFSNSLVMLSYNDLEYIFNKNLEIIIPIGEVKEYVLTHNKPLCKVRKVIDVDFISKILLDKCDKNYTAIKGNLKDFLKGKADAIVYYRKLDADNIFDFPLKLYGLNFNKYFIVARRSFVKKHYQTIEKLNEIFENDFNFRKDLIYKTLLISGLYLNKHIKFNKILFENYKLAKEKNEKYLEVDVSKSWQPFHIFRNDHIYGIGVDFWRLIAKKAHLKYRLNIVNYWTEVLRDIKNKKSDLTIDTSFTSYRKKYALFSKPYASFPLAIICRNDENFKSVNDINSIAVGRNYTAERLMKEHYPDLNYVETKNTFDALELVKQKQVNCAVDILPVMLWMINKNHFINLQLAFKTPFKFDVKIMIRNDKPNVLEKINKAIDKITPMEKRKIINKYVSSVVIQKQNQKYYYKESLIIAVIIFIILIIFLIRKNKRISKEAMYDELTGILNRRGIDVKVKDLEEKGSILFFDIDHFKKVNDTYGHEFGDFVLKEVGEILKEYFRKSDIVGRWGGEEFIAILPNTGYQDAIKVAEELRKIIENYDFQGKKITISIGVSEYKGNLESNLKKADEALYEAKNNGRNQVKGKVV